ncbi:MAG: phosphoribosylformylglycinamidine cyclo-ligase [Spirochaetaceae bacterium]|jgi:phosphoribosylformylglycinamidine cyclo-ligase|nr:phosphoribosylformylglycinamidine cyclo-ligase [Spirochaetaceae bacterium]
MKNSFSEKYKESGVDVTAGYKAVDLIKKHVERARTDGFTGGLGGFGGVFTPDFSGLKEPALVSGADGVGTKLKLAFLLDKHDTVGIDCVAMCVNDVVCSFAAPLFFLDYIACDKITPQKIEAVVSGVADGCVQAGCSLIGGETAEMPSFYANGEYDLAGFAVGLADKTRLPEPSKIKEGDAIIALPSSGVHSNGFSLIRKIFSLSSPDALQRLGSRVDVLGKTLGEELITPTKIYVKTVLALAKKVEILGAAHITGGGFYENIPRVLPAGKQALIQKSAVRTPPIFDLIAAEGGVSPRDMFNTFNMGVGMVLIVKEKDLEKALDELNQAGEAAYALGTVTSGCQGVELA